MQLKSTAQQGKVQGVKVCVYGKSSAGKTRLISTAPSPVILSAEKGLLSLREFNLPYIEVNTLIDLQQAYQWALQSAEARQFHTICLDSISDIAEVVLSAEKGKTKDGRAAYGATNDQLMKIIRDFRDLSHRHVYFVAKEERDKEEATGLMMYGPSMPGKTLTQQLPYFFDELFQLVTFKDQKGVLHRALRTQPDNQNMAKDRSGSLAEYEPADLTHIFNKIMA